jgi:uncharacterized membrane protein
VLTPVLSAFFIATKLLAHAGFHTGFDLSTRVGVVASLARGGGFYNPERGVSLLGEHFEPLLIVFAPFFRLGVGTSALLVAQALAGAFTVALGWLLVRDVLRDLPRDPALAAALVLIVLYAGYRPFVSAVLYDFHMTTMAAPLLAGALLALRRGASVTLWALVAVLLATRENAGLLLFGLALYAGATLGRWRLALALASVGAAAGLLVTAVVMPLFRDGGWRHLERLAPLADPGGKLLYLLQLAGLLLFLPLLAPRSLLAALPTTGLNLAVDYPNQYGGAYHYDDQNSLFWLLAAAHGARVVVPYLVSWWAVRSPQLRARLRRATPLLVSAVAVAALAIGVAVVRSHLPRASERELAARLEPYLALPEETPIVVDGALRSHFAHRRGYRNRQQLESRTTPDGTLVLVLGERLVEASHFDGALLRRDPAFEVVEVHPLLEVYRWWPPPAEPAPR